VLIVLHASCTGTLVVPFSVSNDTSSYRDIDRDGSYRRCLAFLLFSYHRATTGRSKFPRLHHLSRQVRFCPNHWVLCKRVCFSSRLWPFTRYICIPQAIIVMISSVALKGLTFLGRILLSCPSAALSAATLTFTIIGLAVVAVSSRSSRRCRVSPISSLRRWVVRLGRHAEPALNASIRTYTFGISGARSFCVPRKESRVVSIHLSNELPTKRLNYFTCMYA
jgi:hypothetical protein